MASSLFEALEARHLLAVISWDGGPSGNGTAWNDPANWAGDVLPAAGDDVVLEPTGTNPAITLPAGYTARIASFQLARMLLVNGTIESTGSSGVSAAGEIALGGSLRGGTLTSLGLVRPPSAGTGRLHDITVNGEVQVASARRLIIAGRVNLSDVRVSGSGAVGVEPGTVLESGSITTIGVGGTQSIDMTADGTFTIAQAARLASVNSSSARIGMRTVFLGSMSLVNHGLVEHRASGETFLAPAAFRNEGLLDNAGFGTLSMNAPSWVNEGTFLNSSVGVLQLAGSVATAAIGTVRNLSTGRLHLRGTIDNSGANLTLNSSTGSWHLTGTLITGGTITLLDGQTVFPSSSFWGTPRLRNLTVVGEIRFEPAVGTARLAVGGTLSLGVVQAQSLLFEPGTVLDDTEIVFSGASTAARTLVMDGQPGTVEFGPGVTIRTAVGLGGPVTIGTGVAAAMTLINRGRITAAVQTISLTPAVLDNRGVIEATAGQMQVQALSWTNSGTISANSNAAALLLGGGVRTADLGVIQNAGGLVTVSAAINNNGASIVRSGPGESWTLAGASISGGSIRLLDGAQLVPTFTASRLSNLSLDGDITVRNSAQLTLAGTVSVGTLRLANSRASLTFDPGSILTSGVILFEGADTGSRLVGMTGSGGGVTLGPGVQVRCTPDFAGSPIFRPDATPAMSLTNQGQVFADCPGTTITIAANSFVNTGRVEARSGAITISSASWTSPGTLAAGPAGTLNLGGAFSASGSGGLQIEPGGTANITGSINNGTSTFSINGSGATVNLTGGTVVGGTLSLGTGTRLLASPSGGTINGAVVNGEVLFAAGTIATLSGVVSVSLLRMSGSGSILSLSPGTHLASGELVFDGVQSGMRRVVLNGQGGAITLGAQVTVRSEPGLGGTPEIGGGNTTLQNNGTIRSAAGGRTITIKSAGGFVNGGTIDIRPGAAVSVEGNWSQSAAGALVAHVAGLSPTQSGRMSVTGRSTLAGSLTVVENDGFRFAAFDSIDVLTSALRTGQFDTVVLPPPAQPGRDPQVRYVGGIVRVFIAHRADFNNDGVLDPDDLADFVAAYFSSPPPASLDLNGDSIIDPDDLADFISLYFAG